VVKKNRPHQVLFIEKGLKSWKISSSKFHEENLVLNRSKSRHVSYAMNLTYLDKTLLCILKSRTVTENPKQTESVVKNEEYQKARQNEAILRSFGSEQLGDPKPKRWNPGRRSRGACGRPKCSPIW